VSPLDPVLVGTGFTGSSFSRCGSSESSLQVPIKTVSINRFNIDPWFPHDPTQTQSSQWNQTEAEAFLERLWAFKRIKHLLKKAKDAELDADYQYYEDEQVQESFEPEADIASYKDQAKEIALKYHFVTAVTSLVVTSENGVVKPVKPIPVESVKQHKSIYGSTTHHTAYNPTSYSGIRSLKGHAVGRVYRPTTTTTPTTTTFYGMSNIPAYSAYSGMTVSRFIAVVSTETEI
jgi:hypothetical protein